MRANQRQEPRILTTLYLLSTYDGLTLEEIKSRQKLRKYYTIKDDILYRKGRGRSAKLRLVVPETVRADVLRSYHDDIGHPGVEKTSVLIKERYYWFQMHQHIETYVD
jgi:hypothetical protein